MYQFSALKNCPKQGGNRFVIPAEAGIQFSLKPLWIPPCAGMADKEYFQRAKVLRKDVLPYRRKRMKMRYFLIFTLLIAFFGGCGSKVSVGIRSFIKSQTSVLGAIG